MSAPRRTPWPALSAECNCVLLVPLPIGLGSSSPMTLHTRSILTSATAGHRPVHLLRLATFPISFLLYPKRSCTGILFRPLGVNVVFSSSFLHIHLLVSGEDDDLACIHAIPPFPFRRLAMLMPYDNRTLTQYQSSLSKDYLLISSMHAMLKQGGIITFPPHQ